MKNLILHNVRRFAEGTFEETKYFVIRNGVFIGATDTLPTDEDYEYVDAQGAYLLPGFVDIHLHGGGGYDFMDEEEDALEKVCKAHAAHGTTALLATSLASESNELEQFLKKFVRWQGKTAGARLLGVHLEGPYFSYEQRGAQDPAFLTNPVKQDYERLVREYPQICCWTIAPELPGALTMGDFLKSHGVVASIGHSSATSGQVTEAIAHGYTKVTHLYSGMSSVTKINGLRVGGVVEATFSHDELVAEIIADGRHLPLDMLRMIWKIKGPQKVCMITDAMRAAGSNVETSILGSKKNGQPVVIRDGVARLPDGTALAGSIATTDHLLRTAVKAGIPLEDAVTMLTETPARAIGKYPECGSLQKGKHADFVLMDSHLQVIYSAVSGVSYCNKLY